ncbi:glycosyltransferase family 49 protein [Mixia osmundae IAM 14324]|uniref:Glycosyltransferase family 49 protein n=1 Tax=Mixia osmundae (strain CBS 9802 / IAM 14324 / JCM 22182 / KY 12970) TaxID=764103 RepID=G7DZX7_MIXOS|nr:glycosyltransferase family 49 protein [Mixia osmundae IAM 14324]KEI42128.1 glycosyltransferase family 49 protein [Mixia osmundae IAM 14324]GAA96137.1 hypothetical protein E5Q_02798 [Mixia osmundae IAM 14324]
MTFIDLQAGFVLTLSGHEMTSIDVGHGACEGEHCTLASKGTLRREILRGILSLRHLDTHASHTLVMPALVPTYEAPRVTLVSHMTMDRLKAYGVSVVSRWAGSISISVYLTQQTDELDLVEFFRNEQKTAWENVTITIVRPSYAPDEASLLHRLRYPINRLRNLAISVAPAAYVLMTDADFVPSPNMHEIITRHGLPLLDSKITAWPSAHDPRMIIKHAIVIPCFVASPGATQFASSQDELKAHLGARPALLSLTDPTIGHGPTAPHRLIKTQAYEDSPISAWSYSVGFEPEWEPYYLLEKHSHLLYDERFTDQGGDKQSHALLLAALGFRFTVLRGAWLIHPPKVKRMGGLESVDEDELWPMDRHLRRLLQSKSPSAAKKSAKLHFSSAQSDKTRFRYFEGFMPELKATFGSREDLMRRWRGSLRAFVHRHVGRRGLGGLIC